MKIKGRGGVGERGRVLKVKADDVVGNIFSLRVFFFYFYFANDTNNAVSKDKNKNFLACFLLPRAILMGRYSCILFRQTEIQFPLDFVPQNFFQRSADVGNSRHLHTRSDIHRSLSIRSSRIRIRKDRHRLASTPPRRIFNIDNNFVPGRTKYSLLRANKISQAKR